MYKCKTYQGENKQYLKTIPYLKLKQVFLENVNSEQCFKELFDFIEDKSKKSLHSFMIKILSNPNDWTIAELQDLF